VLDADTAKRLVEVGARTPVGELLRRYWLPIAAEKEFDEQTIRPLRVLGEDLVVYRDLSGGYGLIDRHCPHRGFDLAFGSVEERGIRCNHHGWRFDEGGNCLEQPFEETVHPASTFKARIKTRSYAVCAKAGLLWAYLGPEPAPLIPDWAGFYGPGVTVVAFLHVPCNWVQVMEGFYDPVHVEWLHDRWSYRLNGGEVPPRRPTHTAFRWLDFEYGVVFQRKLSGSDRWLADRTVVFPNLDGAGGQGSYLTWVVPMDEENTLLVYRHTITSWKTPLGQVMVPLDRGTEPEPTFAYRKRATLDANAPVPADFGSHLVSQDYASWLGPGAIVDRTREHLGESDRGIIMFREKLLEQAELVARGGDPRGVIRDPATNHKIVLPGARRGYGVRGEGLPGLVGDDDVMLRAFLPFDVPEAVKSAVDAAMSRLVEGLRPDWWKRSSG
jgi:5,5'-dehydrodivanillate O-demethylase